MNTTLPITFLSDYGYEDEFVGVCHGVIRRLAPEATVIDVAHGLPRREVLPAALVLRNALPYLPAGVHLAVVDPGVGGPRRPVALRSGEHFLVGPDNGLLWPAIQRLGEIEEAVDLRESPWRLEPFSATFHGRDLFAPVAARLALGAGLPEAGRPFAPGELVRIELPAPVVSDDGVRCRALHCDRFGNVQLNLNAGGMEAAGFRPGARVAIETPLTRADAHFVRTFGDVGPEEMLLYEDSYRAIAIAVNGGDARAILEIEAGDELRLSRRPG
jgi:S-adenosyl-L-methionine hydrolase (adenosine-forming)